MGKRAGPGAPWFPSGLCQRQCGPQVLDHRVPRAHDEGQQAVILVVGVGARGRAAQRWVAHGVPRANDKGRRAGGGGGGGGGERKCQLQTFPPISSARAEEMHLEPSVLCQLLASADCKGQLGRSHRAEHSSHRNETCEHDLQEQQTSDAGVT